MRICISLVCLLFSMACTPLPREPHWIGSWGASPLPPRETAIGPFPATPAFSNQTIRQTIRLSAGGDRLRLRLTNEYGSGPLEIGAATIARIDPEGEIRLETVHAVTFGGHPSATISRLSRSPSICRRTRVLAPVTRGHCSLPTYRDKAISRQRILERNRRSIRGRFSRAWRSTRANRHGPS
jgi:hypothetical protein